MLSEVSIEQLELTKAATTAMVFTNFNNHRCSLDLFLQIMSAISAWFLNTVWFYSTCWCPWIRTMATRDACQRQAWMCRPLRIRSQSFAVTITVASA